MITNCLLAVLIVVISAVINVSGSHFTPIVLWHGMGDSCCFPFSLGAVQKRLSEDLPGVHIVSVKLGNSLVEDVENGYFMHPDKQIEEVCKVLNNDPQLSDGYNAVGFSQGSQFLRGLVQRCPEPKMKNLISLGGQHQGVYGVPNCASLSHPTCDYIRRLLNHAAYLSWVQKLLVQATYWHDPLNEHEYEAKSTFLADINNERIINKTYVENLQSLDNFVLVKFNGDTMVQPTESEWFGFYKPGQSKYVQRLQDSQLYKNDQLGLKQMDQDGKLHFIELPGNHLQFNWTWFAGNIIDKYLR